MANPLAHLPSLLLAAEVEQVAIVSRQAARQIAANWPRVRGAHTRREQFDAFSETVTRSPHAHYRP